MQLSLSPSLSPASSESVDLLNAPTLATAESPESGFGDLMAGLLPAPDSPAPAESAAAELAGAQATVELLAWMARTPPPPPSVEPSLDPDLVADVGSDLTPPTSGESTGQTTFAETSMSAESGVPFTPPPASTPPTGQRPVQTWARWSTPESNLAMPTADVSAGPLESPTPAKDAGSPLAVPSVPTETTWAQATGSEGGVGVDAEGVVPLPMTFTGAVRGRAEARGEKIAAGARSRALSAESAEMGVEKNFLSADGNEDTKANAEVGISVAKPEFTMTAFTQTPSASAARPDTGAIVAGLEAAGSMGDSGAKPAPVEETPAALAHTAVAAVTKAVERAEAAPRTAVNLQFSIGDSDLVVRIEHRADEVRATFRTDSSELRAALSSEWQSAVSNGSEHALRRVEPVFTSASSNEDPRSPSDGNAPGSQQRQAGRESAGEPVTHFAAFLRRSATSVVNGPSELAPAAHPGLVPTALHLQTFA